jgi:hypothetical protein
MPKGTYASAKAAIMASNGPRRASPTVVVRKALTRSTGMIEPEKYMMTFGSIVCGVFVAADPSG